MAHKMFRTLRQAILSLCVAGAAIVALPLGAATYYVSPTGSDTGTSGSFEAPFKTVNAAMAKCTGNSWDEIRLLPGVYKMTDETGGFVTYKGHRTKLVGHTGNPRDVVIDGCGTNRGLYSDYYAKSNQLASVTVSNCYYKIDGTGTTSGGGAGFQLVTAYSTVSNCVFTDCRVDGDYKYLYAGALLITRSGGITVVDCSFIRNGGGYRGGAVYVDDNQNNVQFIRCAFTNNLARKGNNAPTGGAVAGHINANSKSFSTFIGCTFHGNVVSNDTGACNGGAVFGRAKMRGCVFTDNRTVSGTTTGDGAGWCCLGGAATDACASFTNELIDCTFAGNFAQGDSGAAQTTKAHHLIVSNCLFRANGSLKGAGAASFAAASKRILDCRFIANSNCVYAADNGIVKSGGDCLVARCEFRGNVSHGYSSALLLSGATEALPAIVDSCAFSANLQEYDSAFATPYNRNGDFFAAPLFMGGSYIRARNCLFVANTNLQSCAGAISLINKNNSYHFREVDNCTFVDNRAVGQEITAGSAIVPAATVFSATTAGDAIFRNLIFSGNCNVDDPTLITDFEGSNWKAGVANCLFETAWTKGTTPEDGYNGCKVGKTVKFLNAAQGDYTLKRSSPARGAGVWIDWMDGATDLAGTPRVNPDFGAPDMGCYTCWHKPGLLLLLK